MMRRWGFLLAIHWMIIGVLLAMLLLRKDDRAGSHTGTSDRQPARETLQDAAPITAPLAHALVTSAPLERTPHRGLDPSGEPRAAGETAVLHASGNDPVGCILSGTIRDAQGAAIPNAQVRIRPSDAKPGAGTAGTVNPQGYFIPMLRFGTWKLKVQSTGYRTLDELVEITSARQRHDLVMRRAQMIAVRIVTEDGSELREALKAPGNEHLSVGHAILVQAFSEVPAQPFESGHLRWLPSAILHWPTSGTDGVQVPAGCVCVLELQRDPPCHVVVSCAGSVLGSAPVTPDTSRLEIRVSLANARGAFGSIAAQLVDAKTGQPVSGLQLECKGEQPGDPLSSSGWTDAGGRILVKHIAPGRQEIRAVGKELDCTTAFVAPGQLLDLGVVHVMPMVMMKGNVRGPGEQSARTKIDVWSLDRPDLMPSGSVVSGPNGFFVFWCHVSGRKAFVARAEDHAAVGWTVIEATHGQEPIEIRMLPATPVEIQFAGRDTDVYEVVARNAQKIAVMQLVGTTMRPMSSSLPEGTYELEVRKSGQLLTTIPMQVAATPLRMRLP